MALSLGCNMCNVLQDEASGLDTATQQGLDADRTSSSSETHPRLKKKHFVKHHAVAISDSGTASRRTAGRSKMPCGTLREVFTARYTERF